MVHDNDHVGSSSSDGFVALEQHKGPGQSEHDAFLSYRRRDATQLAHWIRNKLQRFRLPPEILRELPREKQDLHARGPRIWLDTSYEKSSDDFLLRKVFPALDNSARLIVICTPSALESIHAKEDGTTQDNWLVREVDHFLSRSRAENQDRPIDVVFGPGAVEGNYPGGLSERPRWDWVDFRSFSAWRARSFTDSLDEGLAKLVASLYDIPDRFLPVLRREEGRWRKRIMLRLAVAGLSVAAVTTGLAIWGFIEQSKAVTALGNVLVTQAQMSVRLASEELEKKDPARSLATALAGVGTSRIADTDRALVADSITATGNGLASQTFGHTLQGHADAVLRVSLGSGSGSVVTVGADARAILWSRDENSALRPVTSTPLAGSIFAIAENQGFVASGSTDGYVQFWNAAKADLIFEPFNFGERLVALAFSDDGLQIAALGVSGKLAIWDLTKGSIVWTASERVSAAINITFGSNCRCLVVGTGGGDLSVWSLDRRDHLVVHGASGQLFKGVFGEENQFLFATDDGRVWLTSAPTWPTPLNIGQHDRLVTAVVTSADRKWAATASMDGTARVWDLQNRRAWKKIKPMGGAGLSSVSLSPDGSSIALGSGDGSVAVWSIGDANSDPSEVFEMRGHTSGILDLTFSTDGIWLASASLDRTARIWQCRPPRRPRVMEAHKGAAFHSLSSDGRYLVSGGLSDKKIQIWMGAELAPGKSIQLQDQPTALAISDDGQNAFVGTDKGNLLQWDTSSSVVTTLFHGLGNVGAVAISPDQRALAAIGVRANPLLCTIGSPSRCEVVPLAGWGYSVAFSEDGHWMGAASGVENETGHAIVINLDTKEIKSLEGHTERVSRIRFDPKGTRAITASWDGTTRIWSLFSGKELVRIVEPKGRISTSGFSPDGEWVATSSNEKTLRLWKIPNPDATAPTIILESDKSTLVSDKLALANIQFGLDGRILAGSNANGDVYLWHMSDGTLRAVLDAGVPTQDMYLHPDGSQITAMTQTGRLLSWRILPALGFSDESLLGVARSMVPMSGSLMGMTGQSAVRQLNASEVCPFLRGHNVGLPPQNLSGLARARKRVSIPAACYLHSRVNQGNAYLEGQIAEVKGDMTTALAKYQAAVTQREFAADIGLGDLSFMDSIGGIDFDKARTHYDRAREHGVSRAASRLGWLLLVVGAPNNIAQAKAFFEEGSKDGDADGFAGLAWIGERFGSSPRDVEEAFQNYVRAQFAYERDGDFAFAQEVAEHRAMLSRLLPLNDLARLFALARGSTAPLHSRLPQ